MGEPVHIRLDSRIRIALSALDCDVEAALREEFNHVNPAHEKLKRMGYYPSANEPPVIKTWRHEGDDLTLPRGGMQRVRDVLAEHDMDWTVSDKRTEGSIDLWSEIPAHAVQLRDYQAEGRDACKFRENCLARAATGSGKTTMAIGLIAELQMPTLVIVWNGALMDQWVQRLQDELGLKKGDIGIVRAKRFNLKPVTLAMQQTLIKASAEKWQQLCSTFGVVICDEVQRFAARTFLDVVDRFPARYRIGISADETRKDRKEFLVYDVFGDVAHEAKRTELEKRGHIVDVDVVVVPTDFRADWYNDQRKNPSVTADFNRLLDEMTADPARNVLAEDAAMHAVQKEGGVLLVFSHRVEHCRSLDAALAARRVRSKCMLGGVENEEEFVAARVGLRDGTVQAGVGTFQAIGTGHDIPTVTHGVVTTPIATNKQLWGQVRGRLCRPHKGKARATCIYLWDQHVFGWQPLRNLVAWNRSVRVQKDGRLVAAKRMLAEVDTERGRR